MAKQSTPSHAKRDEWEVLQQLAARNRAYMTVETSPDLSEFTIHLQGVDAWVGKSTQTMTVKSQHVMRVYLQPDHPTMRPTVSFDTPLFHPNNWPDGTHCIGTQWMPSRDVATLVVDLVHNMQLITDHSFNLASPANSAAFKHFSNREEVAKMRAKLKPVPLALPDWATPETPTTAVRSRSVRILPPDPAQDASTATHRDASTVRMIRR